jgi:hypothetical protein
VAVREKKRPGDKCHQRDMREAEASLDDRPQDTGPISYDIMPLNDAAEATAFIKRYEWLGTPGHPVARYCARNEFNEIAAVALFGRPNLQSAALCRKLDPRSMTDEDREYVKRVICLERGACAHWAHEHTASWFIPRVLEWANQEHGWEIVYAYSDADAGEIGTIYQACNWTYIGQGVGRALMPDGTPRPRRYYRHMEWPNTRDSISSRAFYSRGLTMENDVGFREDVPDVMELDENKPWIMTEHVAKHKYVQFVGDKATRRKWLRALRYPRLPYPKRVA